MTIGDKLKIININVIELPINRNATVDTIIEKMNILTTSEIQRFVTKFLNKYSKQLELKIYDHEDIVRREGERSQKIFIVKDGIFRIGKTDSLKSNVTIAFN